MDLRGGIRVDEHRPGVGAAAARVQLDSVMRMRTELAVAPQTDYPAYTLRQIRTNLGSDYVVAGSYVVKERQVHLDLILFDTRLGRGIAAIAEDGAEDSLTQLIARCAQRVQAQLGMRLPQAGSEFPKVRWNRIRAVWKPCGRAMR